MAAKKLEYRTLPVTVERRDDGTYIVSGLAAPFGTWTNIGDVFEESIDASAFRRTLQERPDVSMLFNHDSGQPLARTPDTLYFKEAVTGLAFEAVLDRNSTIGRDARAHIQRKTVRGMSIGFSVRDDLWAKGPNDLPRRTLLDIELFEASIVTWPAYESTRVRIGPLQAPRLAAMTPRLASKWWPTATIPSPRAKPK